MIWVDGRTQSSVIGTSSTVRANEIPGATVIVGSNLELNIRSRRFGYVPGDCAKYGRAASINRAGRKIPGCRIHVIYSVAIKSTS